jgi:sister-chromatid-cohesion protein PDS5
MAQDRLLPVRSAFINHLKKKLVQRTHLSHRWYIIPCLLAFEPSKTLKESTLTWLRSRAAFYSQQAQASGKRTEQTMVMELIFSRLLSLLAYHPDYPSDELDESTRLGDLSDFAQYIIYYLSAVANEHNMSLIFHVAQRVKQFRDGITKSDKISTRLHTLSDLAQATIRRFADIYSQQHKFGGGSSGATNLLQTYPGKMGVPSSLFSSMTSHREAQDVADKNFLPDEIDDRLDRVVRAAMKPKSSSHSAQSGYVKKRKPESTDANGNSSASKKPRKEKAGRPPRKSTSSVGVSKPSRRKRTGDDEWPSDVGSDDEKPKSNSARRRSSRGTGKQGVSYADKDSDEDDQEMEKWEEAQEAEDQDDDDEGEEEGVQDSDEEMQDEDDENNDQEENAEDASEKENSPPVPARRGPKPKAKASGSKGNTRAKQPTTTTLPTRRSSRRG